MSWPQVIVIVLMSIGCINKFVEWTKDSSRSSGQVTVMIMLSLVFYAMYAWVLHEGGFW